MEYLSPYVLEHIKKRFPHLEYMAQDMEYNFCEMHVFKVLNYYDYTFDYPYPLIGSIRTLLLNFLRQHFNIVLTERDIYFEF
jgi:hypothetical protein